ncbi:hypothetical protein PR003_g30445 [Phytophthora rubi]|uniref:Uncharacterized protein n=1 Tax=Phytophthora rubi TaxID=129364 RepID=A0A6A3G4X7_9STRA|nr:hypothetical protein PR001_g33556 [Phytophthora rubi]KAE9271663.1 hypothetical protein PR003_g30445 [Phytophthora rubi]
MHINSTNFELEVIRLFTNKANAPNDIRTGKMGKGKSVVLATDSAFELQSTADKCCFRMPDAHEDGNGELDHGHLDRDVSGFIDYKGFIAGFGSFKDSGAAAGSPTEESW